MKKVLIAAVALMMGASISLAGMGIFWSNGSGWMVEYGADPSSVDGPGVLVNNSAIWQLIYAGANDTIDTPDLKAQDYLGGDDQLLANREIAVGGGEAADGTEWSDWLELSNTKSTLYTDADWETAGYVYQRVWQGTPDPSADSYYFDSELLSIDTTYVVGGTGFPQSFSFDPAGAGVAINNVIPGEGPGPEPTVPEPATMSLLGLGALAMILRRKLRK